MRDEQAALAIHDPPYNAVAFEVKYVSEFVEWCRKWISLTYDVLSADSSLYIWMGADQNNGFQPLPDIMVMMRDQQFSPRSFITMRNQRGYGTQRTGWQCGKNYFTILKATLSSKWSTPTFQRFSKVTTRK